MSTANTPQNGVKNGSSPAQVQVAEITKHGQDAYEADSFTSDSAFLATLGYKQEFKRAFRPIEVFGLSFSIIGILPSIAYVHFDCVLHQILTAFVALSSYSPYRMAAP